ncbi:dynamin family protein [Lysinibacillus xylanilyticus]|uniref:dynamin family protein n=1 Tax=Lysinibacillus xylanilyticus TaxID=582475 RepID=UPI003CFBD167
MNEKQYIDKLLALFNENEELSKYFLPHIQVLNHKLVRWEDESIRIGLIGVTSSGKSTVLNALLGDKILPTAVRPSSGSIIICSKGERTKAKIFFEHGKTEEVDEKNIKTALEKYGDEHSNTENKYKVKEIHVESKYFLLPKNIQIIDSPGLDAYGFERHEELTLSTLLPTIDLCLYVVTLKSNSDATTHRILEQIQNQFKPMIIVQNMLDSIEPKIGVNGVIEKTREQIANEHIERTKRILDKVDLSLHEIVQIVQLSAKRAVDARNERNPKKLEQSQLYHLIHMVESYCEKMGPQLFKTRGRALVQQMQTILLEEEKLSGNQVTFEREIKSLKEQIDKDLQMMEQANNILVNQKNHLKEQFLKFNNHVEGQIRNIQSINDTDFICAERTISATKKQMNNIEIDFIEVIKSKHKEIEKLFQLSGTDLNELLRGLVSQKSTHRNTQYFEINSKKKQESKQVKSGGIIGGAKRLVGGLFKKDWGYETVYYDVDILDKQQISQNLRSLSYIMQGVLTQKMDEWANQLKAAIDSLQRLLEDKKFAIQEKEQARQNLKNISFVLGSIRQLIKQLEIDLKANEVKIQQFAKKIKHDRPIMHSGKMVKMPIEPTTYSLYKMSKFFVNNIYHTCFNHVQNANKEIQNYNKTLIIGWDEYSLVQFIQRYPSVMLNNQNFLELKKKGVVILQQYCIVYENALTTHPQKLIDWMGQSNFNVYLLANIVQVGQAKSQIMKSKVVAELKKKQVLCNLVMQSFVEFIESGAYEEAVEMFDDIKSMPIFNNGYRLINDQSPLFSLIHLELDHADTKVHHLTKLTNTIEKKMPYLLSSSHIAFAYKQYINAVSKRKGVNII